MRVPIRVYVALLLFAVAQVVAAAEDPGSPESRSGAAREKLVGRIADHQPFGAMSLNFSGTFQGIEFKLNEASGKSFRYYADSFDQAANAGFMEKGSGGVFTFKDVRGRKVEIEYDPSGTSPFRVTSLKWLDDSNAK